MIYEYKYIYHCERSRVYFCFVLPLLTKHFRILAIRKRFGMKRSADRLISSTNHLQAVPFVWHKMHLDASVCQCEVHFAVIITFFAAAKVKLNVLCKTASIISAVRKWRELLYLLLCAKLKFADSRCCYFFFCIWPALKMYISTDLIEICADFR